MPSAGKLDEQQTPATVLAFDPLGNQTVDRIALKFVDCRQSCPREVDIGFHCRVEQDRRRGGLVQLRQGAQRQHAHRFGAAARRLDDEWGNLRIVAVRQRQDQKRLALRRSTADFRGEGLGRLPSGKLAGDRQP